MINFIVIILAYFIGSISFGILLSKIISPIIMSIIFFIVVTPLAILAKIFKKYFLNLDKTKNLKKNSYWIDIEKYKTISKEIFKVFKCYSKKIEPISVDEAYIDVTYSEYCRGAPEEMAKQMRECIFKDFNRSSTFSRLPGKKDALIRNALPPSLKSRLAGCICSGSIGTSEVIKPTSMSFSIS